MHAVRTLLESATAQQDFVWFCVVLAWLAVGALLVRRWRDASLHRLRHWLGVMGAAGLALALGELVMQTIPPRPFYAPRVGWDYFLSFMQLAQVGAPILLLGSHGGRPLHSSWRWTAAGLLLLVWLARSRAFVAADLVIAAIGLALALRSRAELRRAPPDNSGSRWSLALVLVAGAPLVATTGVWTELLAQQRRWAELSLFALPSAGWQLALGLAVASGLWHSRTAGSGPGANALLARELRGFVRATLVWLAAGLALAILTGWIARRAFEQSLLARARAAAAMVDPGAAQLILTPEFRIVAPSEVSQPNGRQSAVVHSRHLVTAGHRMRQELERVQQANPDLYWAEFLTLRDGWLVSAALADSMPAAKDVSTLHRRATAGDLAAWAERRAFFEGPLITDYAEITRAAAPLLDRDRRMLGWIGLELGAADWAAAQAVARLQTFALVGVGVVLALFMALQRLRRAEQEAAERLAAAALAGDRAKSAFLAKVSHELRTPIQSLLGYGELLGRTPLEAEPRRWLGAMQNQGHLLIRLVNDLIDLSALQSGAFRLAPKPGNLAALVRSATDSLQPRAAAKHLGLRCELDPTVPADLAFDSERMRQVLLNLVGNAIKFTTEGEICVRLAGVAGPATAGTFEVELAVQDTGPGIAPEDHARLFQPFSRLDTGLAVEGAGLGLALTAAICQSMGGGLRLESDGLNGSTFIARLAVARAAPAALAPEVSPAAVSLAGLRVLVADDHPLVRELFLAGLRSAGARCDSAADGLEAVERCETGDYAVVVLDVSMPWLDGFETARRIRAAARAPLRLVGVSAHASADDRQRALAAGMDVFLIKPVALTELVAAVSGWNGRRDGAGGLTDDAELLARLRAQFCLDAPRMQLDLEQATASGDRRLLRTRAHYLKNGADVAGFPELSRLCSQLEQLALHADAVPEPTAVAICQLLATVRAPTPTLSDPTSDS